MCTHRPRASAWLLTCGLLLAPPASADLEFTSQSRSVSAHISSAGSDSQSAPDFGPFDATVTLTYENGDGTYWAHGAQNSTLSAATILAAGATDCGNPFYTTEFLTGNSASDFETTFSPTQPTHISITGQIEVFFDHGGYNEGDVIATIELHATSGTSLYYGLVDWWNDFLDVQFSGVLAPDSYTLAIHASTSIEVGGSPEEPWFGGGGFADYAIELTATPVPVHNLTQDTWHATVQAAIDAASDGDEIVLSPGTYTGPGNRDVHFLGKAIIVRSTDPADPAVVATTVIDCAGVGSGVHFDAMEGSTSVLAGLTIMHAAADGVACLDGSPTISRCTLLENGCAGVYCGFEIPAPHIAHCVISANAGSGVYCEASARPRLDYCRIIGNSGSGVYFDFETQAILNDCVIVANTAVEGAGIYCYEGWPTITNCLIAGNQATENGGGIWWEDSGIDLHGCTLCGNHATCGGAIYGFSDNYYDEAHVLNSVLWGNTAATGPEIALACWEWSSRDALTVSYSNIEGGAADIWVQPPASPEDPEAWTLTLGTGLLAVDPLFVDPDGADNDPTTWHDNDCHLQVTSPCINAGDPGFTAVSGETDIDGEDRVMNGVVDLGADEVPIPEPTLRGDMNCGGSVGFDDINPLVLLLEAPAAWAAAYPNCPVLNGDLNCDGHLDYQDINPFVACLTRGECDCP